MPYFNRDANGKISGGLFFSPQFDGQEFKPDGDAEVTAVVAAMEQGRLKQQLSYAVQDYLDAAARARGYDSIFTAATYADEPAVPRFQADGQALRAWRSLVWAKCYEILGEVEAGARQAPTAGELIATLPPTPE